MSELLEIRVIGAPEVAVEAAARLKELLEVERYGGPYPSRKTPGLVRCYLTGRLRSNPAMLAQRARVLEGAEHDQHQANLAARRTDTGAAPRRGRAAQ